METPVELYKNVPTSSFDFDLVLDTIQFRFLLGLIR